MKSPLNNGLVHHHRQTHHQSIQQQGIKIRDDPEIGHESTRSLRSSMKTPDFCNSVDYEPLKPAKQPDTKNQRPVPKPRRSIQQRRSSYLRSRSVELEPSEGGHNFSVYQRINMPDPTHVMMTERNIGRRRSRADDVTIPPRRSSSLAPTPSPRKNINAKLVSKPVEIDHHPSHHPISQRRASVSEHRPDSSRRMSRASSVCRIKTEPLLYNSQGHPNVQPHHSTNQPPHNYQPSTYNTSSSVIVSRAEESLLNRSQSNSRKQRFSRYLTLTNSFVTLFFRFFRANSLNRQESRESDESYIVDQCPNNNGAYVGSNPYGFHYPSSSTNAYEKDKEPWESNHPATNNSIGQRLNQYTNGDQSGTDSRDTITNDNYYHSNQLR